MVNFILVKLLKNNIEFQYALHLLFFCVNNNKQKICLR